MTCYQLTLSPPSQNWEGVRGRASPHPIDQVVIVETLNLMTLIPFGGLRGPTQPQPKSTSDFLSSLKEGNLGRFWFSFGLKSTKTL